MTVTSPLATSERIPSPRSSNRGSGTTLEPRDEDRKVVAPVVDVDDDDRWSNLPCTD